MIMESNANKIHEALELIKNFGGTDGAHHKQWVLDQVVHILAPDYNEWLLEYQWGEDGPNTYEWDDGVAP
jgi:hypothetical protein